MSLDDFWYVKWERSMSFFVDARSKQKNIIFLWIIKYILQKNAQAYDEEEFPAHRQETGLARTYVCDRQLHWKVELSLCVQDARWSG